MHNNGNDSILTFKQEKNVILEHISSPFGFAAIFLKLSVVRDEGLS